MRTKRLLAFLIALCMLTSISISAFAAKVHPDNTGEEEISPHTIIGTDNRTKVTNTSVKGPNAVCKLTLQFRKANGTIVKKYASGFLYSRQNVGTAGHAIYDPGLRLYIEQITVSPGISPSGKLVPDQIVSRNNCHVHPSYVKNATSGEINSYYDYGAIVLPKAFASPSGYFGLDNELSNSDYTTKYLTLAGYDAKSNQQYKERSNKKVSSVTNYFLEVRYDTLPGMSGSPIYNDERYVVGILTYGASSSETIPESDPRTNSAQRMNQSCFNFLMEYYIKPAS